VAHLSFLMQARDEEPFVREMLRSLKSQAFRDWELLAVAFAEAKVYYSLLAEERLPLTKASFLFRLRAEP